MEANEIAAIGYAVAMIVMALPTLMLLGRRQNGDVAPLLAAAAGATVLWAATLALQGLGYATTQLVTVIMEWLRYIAWLIALIAVLREFDRRRVTEQVRTRYGMLVLLLLVVPFVYYLVLTADPAATVAIVAVGYLLSVLILIATEQIYRNAPADSRSGLGYFCVAIAGIFVYDLALFVLAIAGLDVGGEYRAARGFVNALFAVPLGVGISRKFRLSFDVPIPRQIVFYTFGLTSIGIYVVLTVMGNYYVREYGGSWGDVAGVVLVVAAAGLAAILVVSPSVRGRVRVFLMKTFFQYKYDYRKEWLRFVSTLSASPAS